MAQFFTNDDDFLKAAKINKLEEDAYILSGDIMKANLQYAHTDYLLMQAKDELATAEAKLYLTIRTEKEKIGAKITEATIEALIKSQPDIIRLKQKVAELTAEVDKLKGLKDALSAKSVMLATMLGREN
ncbi:MAG TPA: hypothetical protein PKY72_04375 [Bacilli bacterium]|nr:hypothetical protein [Bacilli bacterium]